MSDPGVTEAGAVRSEPESPRVTLLHDPPAAAGPDPAEAGAPDPELPPLPIELDEDPELVETDQSDRARGPVPWSMIAIAALSLAALVLALVGVQQHNRQQSQDRDRRSLEQVSGQLVGALTTYDYQHLDNWRASVLTHATGSFRSGFNDRFGSVQQLLTASHNRATSTVQGIFVGDATAGRATTVVLVNVAVTGISGTRQFASYDKLTVLKVNGQWQVDDIESLNFDAANGAGSTPAPSATAPTGK